MGRERTRRQQHGSAWHWQQTDCWYYTLPGTKNHLPLFLAAFNQAEHNHGLPSPLYLWEIQQAIASPLSLKGLNGIASGLSISRHGGRQRASNTFLSNHACLRTTTSRETRIAFKNETDSCG
jgi:hypothetical protein